MELLQKESVYVYLYTYITHIHTYTYIRKHIGLYVITRTCVQLSLAFRGFVLSGIENSRDGPKNKNKKFP
jgi:hypothetical protein